MKVLGFEMFITAVSQQSNCDFVALGKMDLPLVHPEIKIMSHDGLSVVIESTSHGLWFQKQTPNGITTNYLTDSWDDAFHKVVKMLNLTDERNMINRAIDRANNLRL